MTDTVFLIAGMPEHEARGWAEVLEGRIDGTTIRVADQHEPAGEVEFLMTYAPRPEQLARYPNLRFISASGAGVEKILKYLDGAGPVPLVRVVDDDLSDRVAEYVVHAVLHHQRDSSFYAASQARREWAQRPPRFPRDCTVAILGMGEIGCRIANRLRPFGYTVTGWSKREKQVYGVVSVAGTEALPALLGQADIVVCVLPLTAETKHIVNAETLAAMKPDSLLINVGRGGLVNDADLLAALDAGTIGGAVLDVFDHEPLEPDHPYWTAPNVIVTPHVAGGVNPRSAYRLVLENVARARAGRPLLNVVDRARGY